MKNTVIITLAALVLIIASCNKTPLEALSEKLVLPEQPYDYTVDNNLSPFFLDNTPSNNLTTDHGATLGRVLFHDKRLSKSNIISCASCHKPENGFGDDKALSKGFINQETRRNSMAIVNLKQKANFFWDQREDQLEEQVMAPISDHIEMGLDDDELVPRLNLLDYYPELFQAAFGSTEITREKVSMALSQYLRAMESYSSKYDAGFETNFQNFTPSELNGKDLFFDKLPCGSCHGDNNLSGWGWANIGLEMEYEDNGTGEIHFSNPEPNGSFAIPTLRNIALSAPYMHDGRFNTLEEVIDHYASNIEPHDWLDHRLRFSNFWNQDISDNVTNTSENSTHGDPLRMSLSASEKQDLVNFMKTFTDYDFITDPKYSNPFVYE